MNKMFVKMTWSVILPACLALLLLAAASPVAHAAQPAELQGVWQGKLAVDPLLLSKLPC